MSVALVLGAGGPVGYAFHAGVLAGLADAGWDARHAGLVVGTSIGAVAAALLRVGMAPADLYARVARTPLSAEGQALLATAGGWPVLPAPGASGAGRWGSPASPTLLKALLRRPSTVRPGLAMAALANAGTVDTAPIRDGLDRLAAGAWRDGGWPDGTLICAVDLDTGRRCVLGGAGAPEASLGSAVAASCAVPSYFAPVAIGGRRYVDGGVVSPVNSDLAAEAAGLEAVGLEAVVVSVPMGRHGPPGRRGIDLPGRRANHAHAARGLRQVAARGVPVLVVEPTARELELMHYDAFDQSHLPAIAARTRATLRRRLEPAAGHRDRSAEAVLAVLQRRPPPAADSVLA